MNFSEIERNLNLNKDIQADIRQIVYECYYDIYNYRNSNFRLFGGYHDCDKDDSGWEEAGEYLQRTFSAVVQKIRDKSVLF